MNKQDIELFLKMIEVPPFNPERGSEIQQQMADFRAGEVDNVTWIRKCLFEIPQNLSEYLLVTFILGSTGGVEAAERAAKVN